MDTSKKLSSIKNWLFYSLIFIINIHGNIGAMQLTECEKKELTEYHKTNSHFNRTFAYKTLCLPIELPKEIKTIIFQNMELLQITFEKKIIQQEANFECFHNYPDLKKYYEENCSGKLGYSRYNAPNHIYLQFTKEQFPELNGQIQILKDVQSRVLSKKELLLFKDLSENIHNQLRNSLHICDYPCSIKNWNWLKSKWIDNNENIRHNHCIKFQYHKKLTLKILTKSAFKSCKNLLPFIIPGLLYHHFYSKQLENLWEQVPDSSVIEENKKKEITNKLIETLQANNIPGSALLEKKIIVPVPYNWIYPLEYNTKYLINKSIEGCIVGIGPMKFAYNFAFYFPTYRCGIINKTRVSLLVAFLSISSSMILSPLLPTISNLVFAFGVPTGLIGITFLTSMIGMIKIIMESYKLKTKSVDLSKKMFKNKSLKEIINYYLTKPFIKIL